MIDKIINEITTIWGFYIFCFFIAIVNCFFIKITYKLLYEIFIPDFYFLYLLRKHKFCKTDRYLNLIDDENIKVLEENLFKACLKNTQQINEIELQIILLKSIYNKEKNESLIPDITKKQKFILTKIVEKIEDDFLLVDHLGKHFFGRFNGFYWWKGKKLK